MGKKLMAIGVFALVAALAHLGCNGDSGSPSSPSVEFQPALPTTTSGSGTSDPGSDNSPAGSPYTVLNGAEVQKRADCSKNQPGWFLPNGYDFNVRLNREDHEFRVVSNLFWAPEPSCQPTNERPGRGTDVTREGNRFNLSFRPEKLCGRYQWDARLIDVTTGEQWDVIAGVFNTGKATCEPPPPPPPQEPTCEEVNAKLSCDGKVGEETVYGTCSWSANADSCAVYEDGDQKASSCNGQEEFSYDRGKNQDSHTWNIVAKKGGVTCDPHDTVIVPPLQENPCEDSYLKMKCGDEDGTLVCHVSSSAAGTLSALGTNRGFGAGDSTVEIPIPEPVCGREIDIEASNECRDTDSETVETDRCVDPECDTSVSASVREDGQVEISWNVDSNVDGGTVTVSIYKDGHLVKTWTDQPRSGRRVKDFDCEDAGSYTVVVTYENDEYGLECEDEAEFEIDECPPQQCEVSVEDDNFCLSNPYGNPAAECGAFGLSPIGKDDNLSGSSHTASMNAVLAIVKGGKCYRLYENVSSGQTLFQPEDNDGRGKDISHVTYCGCPEPN